MKHCIIVIRPVSGIFALFSLTNDHVQESSSGMLELDDADANAMEAVLKFIYHDN